MMEKLGVEKQELLSELRTKYNELKEKQLIYNSSNGLTSLEKQAAAGVINEMAAIQAKISDLTGDAQ